MRKAVMILLALLAIRLLPKALRRQARALELITLLFQLTAAATANTSATASVAARTGNLETRVGNLEQGKFPNVSGGSAITLETQQGSVTLHCGALSNFTSGPQTTFLAGLSQLTAMADWYLSDNFTGPNWGTNERDYINVASSKGQALKNNLSSHGYM